jgi:CDP-diacylglycerol--serine O-phosphatidyltransferase
MAMCLGLSAIRFALAGKWEIAAAAILTAALLDGMDGRIARLLKATSDFGAQLDSLADFVNFGVVPVIVLYLWSLDNLDRQGWAVVLFYVVCCAVRLARFNSTMAKEKPFWADRFFTGMAAPMGASLTLLPMVLSFEFGHEELFRNPTLVAGHVMVMGLLMASRIPTFSIKKIVVKHENAIMIMMGAALVFVMLTIEPWLTLLAIGLGYLSTLGFSSLLYLKYKRNPPPAPAPRKARVRKPKRFSRGGVSSPE